ncbi:glycosyl hydrolase [Azospirillum sp. RWY-5-1]|uniref:Beta-xylanase n=1 Tax=Azospirillum oleiclasticum TaxID=2735135 RepID=A0ABX2TGY9_9PROT|nr:endo-1,4-beta-xylanase [Azospirillum oleiclasticum]NYZ15396.1 glycosyl hydrolase [Azospirillum oleiclasticum]NYZ22418.1 glycosyl hydrolase [Azospirillum oleiclasticum]
MTNPITRRAVLLRTAAAAALAGCGATLDPAVRPAAAGGSAARPAAGSLREACRRRGILHGAARDHIVDPEDPALDRLMAAECDLLVPENGGKWAVFQPQEGRFDWRRFDAAVAEAERIGARPVWHCVLWQHMGMPDYMKLPARRQAELGVTETEYFSPRGTLSAENHWARFTGLVDAVKRRYGDRFYRIDVMNEAFFWETPSSHPHEQDEHGFRKGMWWQVAGGAKGPEWLDPFFRHVRTVFPSAKLVINDFGLEIAEGWQQRKRAYMLRWLEGAVARGVPVDGLGLQSHLMAGKPYDHQGMVRFLKAVDRLGLPVHVTELDVDEQHLPASWSRAQKDGAIAWTAAQYLRDLVQHSRLAEVTWWHLRSDLNYIARRDPQARPQPSPYDARSQRLPLYQAAVEALGEGRSG